MSENASLDSLALRVTALEAENRDLRRKVEDLRRVRGRVATRHRQPPTHHQGERMTADEIVQQLKAELIAWQVVDGEPWPPLGPHLDHRYDVGCAICRASDRPEALRALVVRIQELIEENA